MALELHEQAITFLQQMTEMHTTAAVKQSFRKLQEKILRQADFQFNWTFNIL
jgi:hypothetical protein